MVDIVITYVNEYSEKWQKEFDYWKQKEIKEGKAEENNRQAFGKERTRDWNALKYWFRGVENNLPWVNKVFLVVQNEEHIPEWINKDNPKLRIVYHDEYIPKELLPTFNAMTIGMYIANIEDLGEYYIMCDDDFYFLNPIKKDRFFKYGKPVHQDNKIPCEFYSGDTLTGSDNVFYRILNNNLAFEGRYMYEKVKYGFYHLPEARSKSFEKEILNNQKEEILSRNSISKFRNKLNLCAYMYSDLLKIKDKAYIGNPYKNSCYCTLKSTVNFDDYWDKDIVCFNDTERLDDYIKTKEKFIDFLDRKFPNKSSFEKE